MKKIGLLLCAGIICATGTNANTDIETAINAWAGASTNGDVGYELNGNVVTLTSGADIDINDLIDTLLGDDNLPITDVKVDDRQEVWPIELKDVGFFYNYDTREASNLIVSGANCDIYVPLCYNNGTLLTLTDIYETTLSNICELNLDEEYTSEELLGVSCRFPKSLDLRISQGDDIVRKRSDYEVNAPLYDIQQLTVTSKSASSEVVIDVDVSDNVFNDITSCRLNNVDNELKFRFIQDGIDDMDRSVKGVDNRFAVFYNSNDNAVVGCDVIEYNVTESSDVGSLGNTYFTPRKFHYNLDFEKISECANKVTIDTNGNTVFDYKIIAYFDHEQNDDCNVNRIDIEYDYQGTYDFKITQNPSLTITDDDTTFSNKFIDSVTPTLDACTSTYFPSAKINLDIVTFHLDSDSENFITSINMGEYINYVEQSVLCVPGGNTCTHKYISDRCVSLDYSPSLCTVGALEDYLTFETNDGLSERIVLRTDYDVTNECPSESVFDIAEDDVLLSIETDGDITINVDAGGVEQPFILSEENEIKLQLNNIGDSTSRFTVMIDEVKITLVPLDVTIEPKAYIYKQSDKTILMNVQDSIYYDDVHFCRYFEDSTCKNFYTGYVPEDQLTPNRIDNGVFDTCYAPGSVGTSGTDDQGLHIDRFWLNPSNNPHLNSLKAVEGTVTVEINAFVHSCEEGVNARRVLVSRRLGSSTTIPEGLEDSVLQYIKEATFSRESVSLETGSLAIGMVVGLVLFVSLFALFVLCGKNSPPQPVMNEGVYSTRPTTKHSPQC